MLQTCHGLPRTRVTTLSTNSDNQGQSFSSQVIPAMCQHPHHRRHNREMPGLGCGHLGGRDTIQPLSGLQLLNWLKNKQTKQNYVCVSCVWVCVLCLVCVGQRTTPAPPCGPMLSIGLRLDLLFAAVYPRLAGWQISRILSCLLSSCKSAGILDVCVSAGFWWFLEIQTHILMVAC